MVKIILASTSPRRREIFGTLGVPFDIIAPDFEESFSPNRTAEEEALAFANGKARSVAQYHPDAVVVGGDTLIQLGEQKIGKPQNLTDARRMLRILSANTHVIYTAVVIIDGTGGAGLKAVETVSVKMRELSDAEIEHYLSCNESLDKAGAYSIQGHGRTLIESFSGDYLAAVGLPLKPIAHYLQQKGSGVFS